MMYLSLALRLLLAAPSRNRYIINGSFSMSQADQLTPSKAAPRGPDPAARVYWKLAAFSVAMFAAPLTAYYFSRDRLFGGNPTYAGGLAAFTANVVLVGYVIAAFLEDQDDGRPASSASSNKKPETTLASNSTLLSEKKKDK